MYSRSFVETQYFASLLATVAVVVFNRLEAVTAFEAGQSPLAFVESTIPFVKTAQHLLDRGDVQQAHFIRAVVTLLLHSFPLISVANRLARALPQPPAFVEGVIVDGLHLEQNIIQAMQLLRCRTKPILVGQNHLRAFLLVDVPLNCGSGDSPSRADKITTCPHIRQSAFQLRKLITQLKRTIALERVHDLVWRKRRREATKQVDMIDLHSEIFNLAADLNRFFVQEFFKPGSDIRSQNTASVLRYPNKVIVDVIRCVSGSS